MIKYINHFLDLINLLNIIIPSNIMKDNFIDEMIVIINVIQYNVSSNIDSIMNEL